MAKKSKKTSYRLYNINRLINLKFMDLQPLTLDEMNNINLELRDIVKEVLAKEKLIKNINKDE